MNPKNLYAASHSELTLEVTPLNMAGFRTPFGKAASAFVIEDGTNLIEIIEQQNGYAVIKSKGKEGEAVIGIYSISSGAFIGRVLITVLPGEMTLLLCFSAVIKTVKY